MIDVNMFSYEDLKTGKYEKELSELYKLKNYVEHDLPFHNKQSAFDHTIKVFKGLKELLKLDFIVDVQRRNKIIEQLNKKVDRFTRKELLIQSSLLHDIGKSETFDVDHVVVSAGMIKNFKERFGWSEKDIVFVESLVKNHLAITDLIDKIWKESAKKENFIRKIKEIAGDIYLEELLLVWADTIGLDLKRNDPDYFNSRERICKELINKI
jgi:hypothetical protein